MLRNAKVSTKLVTVLAAPILVLVLLAGYGMVQRTNEADDASRVKQLTEFVTVNSKLINEIEAETVLSGAFLGAEGTAFGDDLHAQWVRTDEALAAYTAAVESVKPGQDSEAIADALRLADQRLGNLKTYRTSVDLGQNIPVDVIQNYATTSSNLITVNARMVQVASDPDLLLGLNTVANFERIMQAKSTTYAIAASVAAEGSFSDARGVTCTAVTQADCVSFSGMGASLEQEEQANLTFDEYASKADRDTRNDVTAALPVDSLNLDIIKQGENGNVVSVGADEYLAEARDASEQFQAVEAGFIANVIDTADNLVANADNARSIYFGLALIGIAFALAVAYYVARMTTGPLRKLTEAAYSLSTDKLPGLVDRLRNPTSGDEPLSASLTPIDIESKDEIGQLANAFNSIQQVTVEVAEEQAQLLRKGIGDIFINLARRNQTLLDRQIEFIDHLEANEEDPDQLDNLFKLDHLATRMRRNAESLLVLAGAEPPRRRGRPVSLADVARVAIGEVEDFARVQLLALDEATVGGNVAVDLAHLLSELMENATHFSPPDTTVEIVGHRAGADGYILSVSDQGIGMTPDQLAEANAQLARPPLVGLALSRSLGFIVIGRLSQRFGVVVKLTASPSGGVTALVTLPADLISYPDDELADPSDVFTGEEVQIDVTDSADLRGAVLPGMIDPAEADIDPVEGRPDRAPYGSAESLELDRREPLDQGPLDEGRLDDLVSDTTPTGDDFDRGLQSLVSDELAPGPVEPAGDERAGTAVDDEPTVAADPVAPEPPAPEPLAPEPLVAEPVAPEPVAPEPVAPEPVAPEPIIAEGAKPLTAAGLVRRTPRKRETSTSPTESAVTASRPVTPSSRSPEEVRKMLSRYRSGLNKGRGSADSDTTTDS